MIEAQTQYKSLFPTDSSFVAANILLYLASQYSGIALALFI
jgi:hypothetical protein